MKMESAALSIRHFPDCEIRHEKFFFPADQQTEVERLENHDAICHNGNDLSDTELIRA